MESNTFDIPGDVIDAFCRRWHVREVALFGSVLRDDFRPESDLDVLVTFADDAAWTLFDLVRMQHELEEIFGRPVDMLDRKAVEESHNWIRRDDILRSAEPFYRAA